MSFTISQLGKKCLVLVLTKKPSGLNAKENFRDGFWLSKLKIKTHRIVELYYPEKSRELHEQS